MLGSCIVKETWGPAGWVQWNVWAIVVRGQEKAAGLGLQLPRYYCVLPDFTVF